MPHRPDPFDRRSALRALAALAAAAHLPRVRACEFYAPGFTIVHPWTRASTEGATTAVVCMKFQDVTQADRLVGVSTAVAEGAELTGEGAGPVLDFAILPGQTTVLGETGLQLRLVGLKQPMEVARSYPMQLRFARAGTVQALLNVDYARFA